MSLKAAAILGSVVGALVLVGLIISIVSTVIS